MKVPVQPVRFRIEEASEGVRISIPRKWSWGILVVLPLELSFFAFFAYFLFCAWISSLFGPGPVAPKLFLTLFSAVWLYLFSRTVFPWFWNLGGRHVLVFDDSMVTLRREIFGLGRIQTFDTRNVSRWRYVFEQVRGKQPTLPSGFAFDFGGKEIRVGTSMDEAEVKQLFAQIRACFPNSGWAPTGKMGA
jgi:hypothetical protein